MNDCCLTTHTYIYTCVCIYVCDCIPVCVCKSRMGFSLMTNLILKVTLQEFNPKIKTEESCKNGEKIRLFTSVCSSFKKYVKFQGILSDSNYFGI